MTELPWRGLELRVLTLHEPWATCVARYGKDIENRGWKPSDAFDGYIAIHAASTKGSIDVPAIHFLNDEMGLFPELFPDGVMLPRATVRSSFHNTGRVVAVARFGGHIPPNGNGGRWHRHGLYGWVLSDVRAIDPFPMTGAQGLRRVSEDDALELWRRYLAA
jgi:hypothetical protein